MNENPEIINIFNEVQQAFNLRKPLLKEWSDKNGGRNVIAFFSSFSHPGAMIQDQDRDYLEELLSKMDSTKGLDLILSSPGGYPLAAERIIQTCQSYSSDFRVVVPKLAKSAATMIAFGAKSILLGETSELGPVDPQINYKDQRGELVTRSAYAVVKGVEEILEKIKQSPMNSRIEGLLSLLPPIDQPFLEECKIAQELSKDIAIRYLKMTTFPSLKERKSSQSDNSDCIENKIKKFLMPEETFSHGRPITFNEAKQIGLKVELLKKEDPKWELLLRIYSRTNFVVQNSTVIKLIENPENSFAASIPPR